MYFEDEILIKYKDYINWDKMILCRYLSDNIIVRLKDELNWKLILKHQKLNINIIKNAYFHIKNNIYYLNDYNAYIFFKYENNEDISDIFSEMRI